ncbi:hypothetical protein [Paraburkholderia silvatlantica]|uniref:Uncharacterized protein n=1 Tax=Paraburkholderia silvatlantica TaxID=321895 RepID=A0A2U1AG57_9BURK|nr:hypothetical protein [Paraburkholderia silvatlantica]MBB2928774.1 hypothetical protein [Paraburkholderia silvatlantica]PVY35357.1 hypothetical protein C7411_105150 [Paraburkholderia silvatlantica]PXW40999.1 hypothetical protein C7413_103150 [Paraburkholderia silvatlantica]PYE27465.1 hypothetical protein C7410_102148 [Paraburkholderia silvatlantica]TDQ98174.1 hypothetical protein C7412_106149 [Paraburkholderia silvatlantica]
MKTKTQYIAPMSLWLVVRKRYNERGLFIEPAWVGVGDGKHDGPAIFTSRILAGIYAHMRNKYYASDDSNNWGIISLQKFDLLQHVRACNGKLFCMMTFGFSFEDAHSIIVKTGAPRIRYVPLPFEPPADTDEITFLFNQWAFDFIRNELRSIGLPKYEEELEAIDELSDDEFEATLKLAISRVNVCREPTERDKSLWGVYSPSHEAWISGDEIPCTSPDEHSARMMH